MPEFAPLDYSSGFNNVPQPGAAFTQGLQGGLEAQNALLQQAVKKYQFGRLQQMQQLSAQVAQNPTPENITQLSVAFPEMSEAYKRSFDMLQPQQQRQQLNFMTQVYAAAQNGQPDVAAQLLNDRATALENSGADPQQIASTRAMAQWATTHPDTFKVSAGTILAGIVGPEKFGQTAKDIADASLTQQTTPAKVVQAGAEASTAATTATLAPAKQTADIQKTQAEAENLSGRLGLDRDKLMSETQLKLRELGLQYGTLPDDSRKIVNDSMTQAAAGEQSAARLTDLATRLEQAQRTTGGAGGLYETIKRAWGAEDGQSALKQEYARIVNNQALASTKDALGGRVTDVDMKTALGNVPGPNASTEVVTSYLRGVAKLQNLEAARQQAQAEWLAKGGRQQTLGPATKDLEIMGTKVPAGTTFADFSRQLIQQKAEQIAAQSALAKAQGRSYLRFAQPAQPNTGTASGTY